ncbi:MAG: hypothetical protein R6X25_08195 [Candidatus Krumholzibacteriia bacterium]
MIFTTSVASGWRPTRVRERPARRSLLASLFAGRLPAGAWALLVVVGVGLATAQAAPPPPTPRERPRPLPPSTERDSLLAQVREYSRLVAGLRDSLAGPGGHRDSIDAARREIIEVTIQEFSGALAELRDELDRFDLRIEDNVIALRDRAGGEVSVHVPRDIGERFSEGITAITRRILEELPDTLRIGDKTHGWTVPLPSSLPRPRRIIDGDAVRLRDDIIIAADEEVRGNVVVLFADGVISGVVRGDVVVLFGDLWVEEGAEISGTVVVLGRFDRGQDAQVGSVTVIDPLHGGGMTVGPWLLFEGWVGFLVIQGLFAVTVVLAALVLLLLPRGRLDVALNTAAARTGRSLAVGLLAATLGHGAVILLSALLVLTIIGIPIAVLLLLAMGLVALVAIAVAAAALGRRICAVAGLACTRPWLIGILGIFLLHLPVFVASLVGALAGGSGLASALALAATLVVAAAYVIGLGALLQSRFGTAADQRTSTTEPRLTSRPSVST